jgi:CMP-N,N'-diacetyllegionaminic acid synthase
MINLGLIPARGGSERLPNKNTIDLGGKPLIVWTIKAAQESAKFDRIICSTDDHGIAAVASQYGCEIIERPKELSQADSASISVLEHVETTIHSDTICLLQPTSPFRRSTDIINAYLMLEHTGCDAVVSVAEAPPDLVFDFGLGNRLRPKQNAVVCNGGIYLITTDHLLNKGDWYNGVTYGYLMPKERSLDIDTRADLDLARQYLLKEDAK